MLTEPPQRDVLRASVIDRFRRVATAPDQERFPVGPESAKKLGYDPAEVDTLPSAVTESFCGGEAGRHQGRFITAGSGEACASHQVLFTSPLSQSDHIILDREEPTGESVGTP